MKRYAELYGDLRKYSVDNWPGRRGMKFRENYYRPQFGKLGTNPHFGERLLLTDSKNIEIEDNFSCWRDCVLYAGGDGKIEIGNNVAFNSNVYINAAVKGVVRIMNDVMIAPNVVIRPTIHNTDRIDMTMSKQGHSPGKITICSDVWIGAGVVISGNVTVGQGSIIGANSVVTKDVPEYTFCAGAPLKIIRERK